MRDVYLPPLRYQHLVDQPSRNHQYRLAGSTTNATNVQSSVDIRPHREQPPCNVVVIDSTEQLSRNFHGAREQPAWLPSCLSLGASPTGIERRPAACLPRVPPSYPTGVSGSLLFLVNNHGVRYRCNQHIR